VPLYCKHTDGPSIQSTHTAALARSVASGPARPLWGLQFPVLKETAVGFWSASHVISWLNLKSLKSTCTIFLSCIPQYSTSPTIHLVIILPVHATTFPAGSCSCPLALIHSHGLRRHDRPAPTTDPHKDMQMSALFACVLFSLISLLYSVPHALHFVQTIVGGGRKLLSVALCCPAFDDAGGFTRSLGLRCLSKRSSGCNHSRSSRLAASNVGIT